MKNIYNIKNIHDHEINNIAEYNLIHDMLNYSKRIKNNNSHYYHILNVCMDICRGKKNYKEFQI